MKFKDIWYLLKQSVQEWSEDKASRLAAALSYYTIFSLAPLMVIVIAVAGLVFGAEAARGAIVEQIGGLVGQQGAEQIQTMIQNANQPGRGIIATILGIVILLIGASGVFGQLKDAMNTIWDVKPKEGRGVIGIIKDRFLSFTMVLGIAFLLMVSLVVSTAITALGNVFLGMFPGAEAVLRIVNFVVSFLIITFLFVLMFKFLPDAKIVWSDVWLGSAVTALLFTLGRVGIGLYLGNSNVTSVFGAAASIIVLLIWVYYSGLILFFGAEFTQVYANTFGSRIVPAENAEPLTEGERAKQGIPHRDSQPAQPGLAGTSPRTAVPSLQAVPVTGQQPHPEAWEKAQHEQENPGKLILQTALPALAAFLIGLAGSIAIAREQRHRPLGRSKD